MFRSILTVFAAAVLVGCAVNPVTGERELAFVSTARELAIGEQQYGPGRQIFGGDYVVDPVVIDYVRGVGARLATVSDRDLPYEFAVINDSTPNAWALPGGKIAINRGLLVELGSEAELAAVLGHEIVHAAARHGAKSMQRSVLMQGVYVAAAVSANQSDYGSLLMDATGTGLQLVRQKYGRDAERESDRYGMLYMSRAGYDPAAAVDLQETFLRLFEGRRNDWLSGLFASHPPSAERLENNRAMLAGLPAGGELGRARYQQAIRTLVRTKAAYEAHDRGRKALAGDKPAEALAAAGEALAIEPREALFHALQGDVRSVQKRWAEAISDYDNAVERNPGYFYPLMRRGLAHRELGNKTGATADLRRSIELLPTAVALNALGELSRESGRRDEAIRFFQAAARADSAAGRAAANSLMRLQLPDKPYLYLKTAVGRDRAGRLVAELQNVTGTAITAAEISLQYADILGRTRVITRPVRVTVPPGQVRRLVIDSRMLAGIAEPPRLRAAVTRARTPPIPDGGPGE